MSDLTLTRISYGPTCTLGRLSWGDHSLCTIEDAWKGNEPMISCIPDGIYQVVPQQFHPGSPKGYVAWEVTGVPNRSQIKIHRANTAQDVTGCIAVGKIFGCLYAQLAVLDSFEAFEELFASWGHLPFELEIAPLPPLVGTKGTA